MTDTEESISRLQFIRDFGSFPTNALCPVCKTNNAGKYITVTIDDQKTEATKAIHLNCAIATNINAELKILYRRVNQ